MAGCQGSLLAVRHSDSFIKTSVNEWDTDVKRNERTRSTQINHVL
jgi:hypothetical protein